MYPSLANQLFIHDHNSYFSLLHSDNGLISEWLNRHKETILSDLLLEKSLRRLLAKEDQEVNKLYDLVITLIAKYETSKNGRFSLFIVELDSLITRHTQLETEQIELLFNAIFLALSHSLEDRLLILVDKNFQEISQHLRLTKCLEKKFSTIEQTSQRISQELLQLNINRRWKINGTTLQQYINNFLNELLSYRCDNTKNYGFFYGLCFVKNFLKHENLMYLDFLELLILKLERELSDIHSMTFHGTELLLGALDRFPFIHLITTHYSKHLASLSPIDDLILFRILLDAKKDSQLQQIWTLMLNPLCLAIDAERLVELKNEHHILKDKLRVECERLQLDWLDSAFDYLFKVSSSLLDHNHITRLIEPNIHSFVIKISEGLTDNYGIIKLRDQLVGVFLCAHYASLVSTDILSCKNRFRYEMSMQLDYTSHLSVWKKYKQISLALAQLDINIEKIPSVNLAKVQNIFKELDPVILDAIHTNTLWWPKSLNIDTFAQDYHGCRQEDLALLLIKLFIYKKTFSTKSINYLIAYLSSHLNLTNQVSSYAKIRKILSSIYDQLSTEPHVTEFSKLISQLLSRLHEATAAKNLPIHLTEIIENTTNSGTKSFANTLREHPEWTPPNGNEQAWQLGKQDNLWLLRKISQVFSLGLNNSQQHLFWWFSLGVAKHIRNVPLKFLSANLNALSQALFDALSSDEALAILNIIKALYRSSFGIETDIYENSPDMYVPSMLSSKVWQQVFRTPSNKHLLFQKHFKALVGCAPPLLETVAEQLPMRLTNYGDEEYAWQQLYPHYYALIETHGSVVIEETWHEWLNAISHQLPTGAGTFWLSSLTYALEPMRQIGLAIQLRKNQDKVREHMAVKIADERIQVNEAAGLRPALLSSLLQKISLHLMTDSPSLAALNIGRYLVFEGNNIYNFSTRTWRLLWLGLDESLRPHLNKTEAHALDIWTSQWLAMTDLLPKVKNFSNTLFNNKQLSFADSYDEEMQWREVISGILASALTANAAPYNGGRLAQRLALSCSIFARENPASWNERRLGLEQVYDLIKDPILRGRLTDRHSQIATVLFNRERLLEAGDLQPTHQYSLMFSEFNWAKHLWRFASLTRQLDEGRIGASYDDSIIANLNHDLPPNSTQVTQIGEQMKQAFAFEIGHELVKKRWLSNQKLPLNKGQSTSLKLILCLAPLQDLLPAQVIRAQISHYINFGFHHENTATNLEYFSVFFENLKKDRLSNHLSELVLDRLYEHCVSVLCANRISHQRIFISKEIRLGHTEHKTELTDLFMAHWSVFMRYHQGDLDIRRAIEVLKTEFFNNEWAVIKESISLIIKQMIKHASNTEQKFLNELSNVALNVQESVQ
ncbi:hypothetical protein [Agitococcus lubricus]|uniref:Uncharacterized protein n=1 Tax=Agitococcus lubricus TaxID=1077255 RepID=A0A2T5IRV0_9GAMM|nr:hypothetical protein [Agitococcus lubricus]PTQ86565.1 hypothetical protein C8N29_1372 [Agitococcus lubricus]